MLRLFKRFLSDTSAAVAIESVLVFPILVWAWVGSFAYFDAYRVYNTSIKATFTIADLMSRQTTTLTASDIEGYGRMLDSLIRDTYSVDMRATQIVRNDDGDYVVDWSHATGTQVELFDVNIPDIQSQLPNIDIGERIIVLESFVDYRAPFDMTFDNVVYDNFTVTRPRYAGQVRFEDDLEEDEGTTGTGDADET